MTLDNPPAIPLLPDLVTVPAGAFWMGDDAGRPDERPAHRVWVDAFAVARIPVTNSHFEKFLGLGEPVRPRPSPSWALTDGWCPFPNPLRSGLRPGTPVPPRFWEDPRFNDPAQPVVGVSWHDAVAYCDWLSAQTGRRCRLPTEAEWERAARGGREHETYPWGDDPAGWTDDPALARTRQEQPYPAGRSRPNGFGLLDMGYNVHEWCSDWFAPDYYGAAPDRHPRGPDHGTRRASRGGAWRHQIQVCRNAARSSLDPGFRYNDYGFRVFADAEET